MTRYVVREAPRIAGWYEVYDTQTCSTPAFIGNRSIYQGRDHSKAEAEAARLNEGETMTHEGWLTATQGPEKGIWVVCSCGWQRFLGDRPFIDEALEAFDRHE